MSAQKSMDRAGRPQNHGGPDMEAEAILYVGKRLFPVTSPVSVTVLQYHNPEILNIDRTENIQCETSTELV